MKKMKEISLPFNPVASSPKNKSKSYRERKTRLTFAVCFFAVCGLLCGLVGFLLTIIAVFEADEFRHWNSKIGSIFIFSAFPLFFLAAHSLDRIEDLKKAEKSDNGNK